MQPPEQEPWSEPLSPGLGPTWDPVPQAGLLGELRLRRHLLPSWGLGPDTQHGKPLGMGLGTGSAALPECQGICAQREPADPVALSTRQGGRETPDTDVLGFQCHAWGT